jgi:hypothetical protein
MPAKDHARIMATQIPVIGGTMLIIPKEKPERIVIAAPVFEASAVLLTVSLSIDVK